MENISPKLRVGKLTYEQKDILVSFIETHPRLGKGKFDATFTSNKATLLWSKLTNRLNSCAGPSKSITEWRKCWHDLKRTAKDKVARIKKQKQEASEGKDGPAAIVEVLTPLQERIVSIINGRFGVSGQHTSTESINDSELLLVRTPLNTFSSISILNLQECDTSFPAINSIDSCETSIPIISSIESGDPSVPANTSGEPSIPVNSSVEVGEPLLIPVITNLESCEASVKPRPEESSALTNLSGDVASSNATNESELLREERKLVSEGHDVLNPLVEFSEDSTDSSVDLTNQYATDSSIDQAPSVSSNKKGKKRKRHHSVSVTAQVADHFTSLQQQKLALKREFLELEKQRFLFLKQMEEKKLQCKRRQTIALETIAAFFTRKPC